MGFCRLMAVEFFLAFCMRASTYKIVSKNKSKYDATRFAQLSSFFNTSSKFRKDGITHLEERFRILGYSITTVAPAIT